MKTDEIYAHIADAIEDQGSNANMYIPGIGLILKHGVIQTEVIKEYERLRDEYKAQQEFRKYE